MDSTSGGYSNCNENMSNHITSHVAKRRRLEGTPGTLNNSAAIWNCSNIPPSSHNVEPVWAIDRFGAVVSPFDTSMDQSIAAVGHGCPSQAFSQSRPYLSQLRNNGISTEVRDCNDKEMSPSWFPGPRYESSTMMLSASWNTATATHESSTSYCPDWNMTSQRLPTESSNLYQEEAHYNFLGEPSSVGLIPNYSAQAHHQSANSTQWSEPIASDTLHIGVSLHTKIEEISQENLPGNLSLNLSVPYDGHGPAALMDTPSKNNENEIVCFGMIMDISGECQLPPGVCPQPSSSTCPVKLDRALNFNSVSDGDLNGTISNRHSQLLNALLDESSLTLQAACLLGEEKSENRKTRTYLPYMVPCSVLVIIYGPLSLCEELGEFFQEYDIYLQDPRGCDMDVRYCNPHRLSSTDLASCPMTSELSSQGAHLGAFNLEEAPKQLDLLAILDSQRDLPEAPQPDAIRTPLERHQRQALSFMLQREKGWALDGRCPDIWEMKKASQGYCFINRVSNVYQTQEPPQFCGGIIADPMGLGKTLSMIALVATDLGRDYPKNLTPDCTDSNVSNKTTLVIVPPSVLESWEEQMSQHVAKSALTWGRHHGKSRLAQLSDLEKYDLVVTTYHTVSAEWKNVNQAEKSILFSTRWRRVILDEAHLIRNSGSRMSKAICSLLTDARWAVTGTPIQNRLGDLVALLKFLQVYPYNDATRFDADITHLVKEGEIEEAVKRLKRLSGCLLLRRPKETINLPARRDLRCVVDFSIDERALYDEIKSKVVVNFRETTTEGTERSGAATFVNIIQQINSLRMICNMGLQYHSRHDNDTTEADMQGRSNWSEVAQETFDFQCEAESIICQFCLSSLGLTETLLGERHTNPRFSQCLRFICSECTHRLHKSSKPLTCGHSPSHAIAPVSSNQKHLEEAPASSLPMDDFQTSFIGLPSKVTSLVTQLQAQPADVKCLVFSSWRMTLDVVEAGLKQAHINYLRFDGKVPHKSRQAILDKFRKDPTIKVMILTLSCGAVGLTLTEASYAYLMEPHWNPTIEEQALARIHRIGQRKEVTTVRFFVKDTFEERVIEIQEAKKDLASVLFSPHKESTAGDVGRLEWLCNLL